MKGIIKKLFTLFLAILTIITVTSCGKSKKDAIAYNPNLGDIVRDDDLNMDMFDGYDLNQMEVKEPDKFCSTYMDVDPNFGLNLYVKNAHLGAEQLKEAVKITDSKQNEVPIELTEVAFNDTLEHPDTFKLASDEPTGFKKGEIYTVTLDDSENVFFQDRDESIKKVMFNVKEEDKDEFELVDGYTFYDVNKVSDFEGFGDYDTFLIYSGKFDNKVGDIVGFKDPKETDEKAEKYFIKITKIENLKKNKYKIHYVSPEAKELFKQVDCHVDHKQVDMNKYLSLKTKEDIIKQLKESTFVEECMAHAAYAYNYDKQLLADGQSFWDNVYINLSFNLTDNGFVFGVSMSYTFTFKSGWRVMLVANAKFSYSMAVSGDAELETFLGIPTGLSLSASAENDVQFGIEFRAVVANPKFNPDWVEATPQNYKWSDAQKAVKELKNKWLDKGAGDVNRDAVEGDTLMLNIGWISFRIAGWIAFDFDLYLCLKNQLNITIGLGYTYSYHSVMISYSSSSGNNDSGCSPSAIREHALNGSFAGSYSAEVYLKLRLSIYITGLKWLACFYMDIDAGFYFEIGGIVELNFDFVSDMADVSGAFYLEFGIFIRITLNFYIIGLIQPNYTLLDKRLPAIKFTVDNHLKERGADEHPTINLNNTMTNANATQLLTYNVFDPKAFGSVVKNYSYDEESVFFEMFLEPIGKYKMFDNFEVEDSRVKFENGYFIVDETVAALDTKITYKYYDISGEKYDDYAFIHYVSDRAVTLTFDGLNPQLYLPGDIAVFPEPTTIAGKVFKGYKYDGVLYHSYDKFIVPDHNVDFEVVYIENKTFTVEYYDGIGNLVYTEKVFNQDAAKGPDASVRDAKMSDEYGFVCYDQSIDCITKDMKVNAIYTRKGDR